MKKKRFVLYLLGVILAGAVWWWTGPRYTLDGPPTLTVSAGGEAVTVGYWSAHWDSPTAAFIADGELPTAPYVRSRQAVVYVREGTQALTLSYPATPSHVTVTCTPDSGEKTVTLYDGWGKRKLSIPLPENFRGIYEVSERWQTTGSAARGFLVVGTGEPVGDPKLTEPPALTVAATDGTAVTARLGSYFWCVWLGGDEMEGTIADAAHPLTMENLPSLSAQPGDRLQLQFTVSPNKLSVWAWTVRDGVEQEPIQVELLPGGNDLPVPELEGAAVLEVRGSWSLAGNAGGEVSYLFEIA